MSFCWRTVNLSPAPHPISNNKRKITYRNASKHTVNYMLGFCAFLLCFPSYTTPQFPFLQHTYCVHLHHLQGTQPVPGKDLHQCVDRHTEESAPRVDSTSWYLRACLGLTRLSFSKFLSWLGCRAWQSHPMLPRLSRESPMGKLCRCMSDFTTHGKYGVPYLSTQNINVSIGEGDHCVPLPVTGIT